MNAQEKELKIGLESGRTVIITSRQIDKDSLVVQAAKLVQELRERTSRKACFLLYGRVLFVVRLSEVSFVTTNFPLPVRAVKTPASALKPKKKKAAAAKPAKTAPEKKTASKKTPAKKTPAKKTRAPAKSAG